MTHCLPFLSHTLTHATHMCACTHTHKHTHVHTLTHKYLSIAPAHLCMPK
uniref:Uncharacterized protein n=1 Tax=Anguilla anguilla TaxID=7936 RepID=A0A0E9VMP7_ANGAN